MRKRKHSAHANHERWLVSYADFITLLFAFFVVMYATSKADQKKQAQAAASIHSAFQALALFPSSAKDKGKGAGFIPADDTTVSQVNVLLGEQLMVPPKEKEDLEHIKRHLQGILSSQIAQHVVSVEIGNQGLVISLREAGFYDSGSANPHPESIKTLDQIADVILSTPYDIRIEGHTDNIPIHTAQFESNWELSTARATHMARLFIVGHRFSPARLSAAGYAEYHPVTTNDTAEGRGKNRRVDIIVLPLPASQQPTVNVAQDAVPSAASILHAANTVPATESAPAQKVSR